MYKLIFVTVFSFFTLSSNAQHRHHGHVHRHTNHYHWIAPVVIGGVVGYAIANAPRADAAPPVSYIEQPPVCPYGTFPIYTRRYIIDQWGRYIPYNQLLGCQ